METYFAKSEYVISTNYVKIRTHNTENLALFLSSLRLKSTGKIEVNKDTFLS